MWLNTLLRGSWATTPAPPETTPEIGRGDTVRVGSNAEQWSRAAILDREFMHVDMPSASKEQFAFLFLEPGHEDDDPEKRIIYARKRFIDWRLLPDPDVLTVPLYRGFLKVGNLPTDDLTRNQLSAIVINKLTGDSLAVEIAAARARRNNNG